MLIDHVPEGISATAFAAKLNRKFNPPLHEKIGVAEPEMIGGLVDWTVEILRQRLAVASDPETTTAIQDAIADASSAPSWADVGSIYRGHALAGRKRSVRDYDHTAAYAFAAATALRAIYETLTPEQSRLVDTTIAEAMEAQGYPETGGRA